MRYRGIFPIRKKDGNLNMMPKALALVEDHAGGVVIVPNSGDAHFFAASISPFGKGGYRGIS